MIFHNYQNNEVAICSKDFALVIGAELMDLGKTENWQVFKIE